ncbi:MAG: ribose 5-phosphate isomerase B [Clostridia bacterium]|nr:ribose 5-phosphate isomerase B [Clostridia bacterium]
MKIAIGCDHAGVDYKLVIIEHLNKNGIETEDFGTYDKQSCHYPIYAKKVTDSVVSGDADFGILVCGTGIGMSIAANKVKGIRAAHVTDCFSAEATRQHNNANVLCLGQRIIGEGLALKIVDIFIETEFLGGRHQERLDLFDK